MVVLVFSGVTYGKQCPRMILFCLLWVKTIELCVEALGSNPVLHLSPLFPVISLLMSVIKMSHKKCKALTPNIQGLNSSRWTM